jgi:hypothetical protein
MNIAPSIALSTRREKNEEEFHGEMTRGKSRRSCCPWRRFDMLAMANAFAKAASSIKRAHERKTACPELVEG